MVRVTTPVAPAPPRRGRSRRHPPRFRHRPPFRVRSARRRPPRSPSRLPSRRSTTRASPTPASSTTARHPVRLLEDIRFRWAWRRRRLALPGRRDRDDASPYGYAVPRTGVAPAAVVAIVAAALALGGWLGLQTSSARPRWLGPTPPTRRPARSPGARDGRRGRPRGDRRTQHRARRWPARPRDRHAAERAGRGRARAAPRQPARRGRLRRRPRAAARALRRNARLRAAGPCRRGRRPARLRRASTAVASAERDLQRLIGSVL